MKVNYLLSKVIFNAESKFRILIVATRNKALINRFVLGLPELELLHGIQVSAVD